LDSSFNGRGLRTLFGGSNGKKATEMLAISCLSISCFLAPLHYNSYPLATIRRFYLPTILRSCDLASSCRPGRSIALSSVSHRSSAVHVPPPCNHSASTFLGSCGVLFGTVLGLSGLMFCRLSLRILARIRLFWAYPAVSLVCLSCDAFLSPPTTRSPDVCGLFPHSSSLTLLPSRQQHNPLH
jgi:hypothetical protein